jgi:hypothetical protein
LIWKEEQGGFPFWKDTRRSRKKKKAAGKKAAGGSKGVDEVYLILYLFTAAAAPFLPLKIHDNFSS